MVSSGSIQADFGRLHKVIPNIILQHTKSFNVHDFFKTKKKGGIFAHVNNYILSYFYDNIVDSPAKELASYELIKHITEGDIVNDAKTHNIYEEVDFAHIMQICKRHIVGGEKLLFEEGKSNLFFVRNKEEALCLVLVFSSENGWYVSGGLLDTSRIRPLKYRSFFRN